LKAKRPDQKIIAFAYIIFIVFSHLLHLGYIEEIETTETPATSGFLLASQLAYLAQLPEDSNYSIVFDKKNEMYDINGLSLCFFCFRTMTLFCKTTRLQSKFFRIFRMRTKGKMIKNLFLKHSKVEISYLAVPNYVK